METSPMDNRVLMVNKALMGSSLKEASLEDHLEVRQQLMEDVMKVKAACVVYSSCKYPWFTGIFVSGFRYNIQL